MRSANKESRYMEGVAKTSLTSSFDFKQQSLIHSINIIFQITA